MDVRLFVTFVILNIANVIIQTVKSIVTVKCGKTVAAIVNAVAYGLYTIVTVYMLCELPLMSKAAIVAICNLVGVYVVKYCEEKARKDKLWKIEATFHNTSQILNAIENITIPHNMINVGPHIIVNFYCATQKESTIAKNFINMYDGKYFASESKVL